MKFPAVIVKIFDFCMITTFCLVPTQGWAKSAINKNWNGLAIKGYDPVAYFTLGKPIEGKKKFEYKWQDVKWHFANEKHLNLFKSNPEKYAPQYGGY